MAATHPTSSIHLRNSFEQVIGSIQYIVNDKGRYLNTRIDDMGVIMEGKFAKKDGDELRSLKAKNTELESRLQALEKKSSGGGVASPVAVSDNSNNNNYSSLMARVERVEQGLVTTNGVLELFRDKVVPDLSKALVQSKVGATMEDVRTMVHNSLRDHSKSMETIKREINHEITKTNRAMDDFSRDVQGTKVYMANQTADTLKGLDILMKNLEEKSVIPTGSNPVPTWYATEEKKIKEYVDQSIHSASLPREPSVLELRLNRDRQWMVEIKEAFVEQERTLDEKLNQIRAHHRETFFEHRAQCAESKREWTNTYENLDARLVQQMAHIESMDAANTDQHCSIGVSISRLDKEINKLKEYLDDTVSLGTFRDRLEEIRDEFKVMMADRVCELARKVNTPPSSPPPPPPASVIPVVTTVTPMAIVVDEKSNDGVVVMARCRTTGRPPKKRSLEEVNDADESLPWPIGIRPDHNLPASTHHLGRMARIDYARSHPGDVNKWHIHVNKHARRVVYDPEETEDEDEHEEKKKTEAGM